MNLARLDHADDWRRFWWIIPPLIIAGLVFAALETADSLAGGGEAHMSDVLNQSVAAQGVNLVTVANPLGEIRVEAGTAPEIQVRITRRGSGQTMDGAFSDLATLQVRVEQTGGTIRIRCWREGTSQPSSASGWAVAVIAPPDISVVAESGFGDITVNGMTGNVEATARDGDVTVRLPRGVPYELATAVARPSIDLRQAPPIALGTAVVRPGIVAKLALAAPRGSVAVQSLD